MFRALAKDPADRFSSVSTFAEALEEAFFGTTNNAFVDKGEEELHVTICAWAARGRSAGNASSHSGTILTTRHPETPGRWTLAA